jgi:spore maturation protein CgeB
VTGVQTCALPISIPKEFFKKYAGREEVRSLYNSSKIALGLHSIINSPTMMSMRTAEVLGCGTFYLSQYALALETNFIKGVHLEWSNSPEETLDLVKYYLEHEEEREKIAKCGQEKIYKDFNYQKLVFNSLKEMGL